MNGLDLFFLSSDQRRVYYTEKLAQLTPPKTENDRRLISVCKRFLTDDDTFLYLLDYAETEEQKPEATTEDRLFSETIAESESLASLNLHELRILLEENDDDPLSSGIERARSSIAENGGSSNPGGKLPETPDLLDLNELRALLHEVYEDLCFSGLKQLDPDDAEKDASVSVENRSRKASENPDSLNLDEFRTLLDEYSDEGIISRRWGWFLQDKVTK